ncbi:large conductance mechanosensitive channel protein MscL [Cryobacterium tagatosivorans]|uniref:Large-conductance mechanosensitive channel n=1 Tax=Cryobacterium tagatosivorans TaxID=1259199 RepID=A0A4V3I6T2_9MICO|nr:large conductance mechanosensitive channel protein MscL [Cryobacterium tagatosivorans]TFB55182.1 large conductance mechanosensitive channel protein MscL [Cryobacterium tagatosivorans]
MLKGFRDFIMRGNVIDLAVAFVVGVAFTAVVTAIVEGIFNPLIATLFNAESLAKSMVVELPGGAKLSFGLVLAAIITFLLVAAVVYFVFVMPINKMKETQERRRKAGLPAGADAVPATELDLLTEIRDLLASRQSEDPRQTP